MLSSRPTAVLCSLLLLLAVAGQAQAASRARFLGQKQQGSAPSSEQSVGGPAAEVRQQPACDSRCATAGFDAGGEVNASQR